METRTFECARCHKRARSSIQLVMPCPAGCGTMQNANINLALSSIYDHDEEKILRELEYIQENTDVELEEVTQEMIEEYAKEQEMPIGPNPEILTLLDSYCSELHERGDYVKSLPYLQNLYDLTGAPEVMKIIKEIKSGKLKGKK